MRKAFLLLFVAALAGCAAVKGPDTPVTMRLSPSFTGAAPVAGSVAVAPVQARGVNGGMRYAYVDAQAPGEIHQAATLFWEEPPPRIMERALVAGLRSRFAAVSGPELAVPADRRVVAVLTRFEEMTDGGAAQAVVGFDVSILSGGKVERSGRYCGAAPVASPSGTSRARAFETAIENAVSHFVQDMAAATVSPISC